MSNTMMTYGTSGFAVPVESTGRPEKAPEGLIATRAVETLAGWIGQVLIGGEIVVESDTFEASADAVTAVNRLVASRIRALFVEPLLDIRAPAAE